MSWTNLTFLIGLSVTHLIELAELKTGCSAMVVAINKQDKLECKWSYLV